MAGLTRRTLIIVAVTAALAGAALVAAYHLWSVWSDPTPARVETISAVARS